MGLSDRKGVALQALQHGLPQLRHEPHCRFREACKLLAHMSSKEQRRDQPPVSVTLNDACERKVNTYASSIARLGATKQSCHMEGTGRSVRASKPVRQLLTKRHTK
jgi:hypothetical protein